MTSKLPDEQIVIIISFDGQKNGLDNLILFPVEVAVLGLSLSNQMAECLLLGRVDNTFILHRFVSILLIEEFLLLADSEIVHISFVHLVQAFVILQNEFALLVTLLDFSSVEEIAPLFLQKIVHANSLAVCEDKKPIEHLHIVEEFDVDLEKALVEHRSYDTSPFLARLVVKLRGLTIDVELVSQLV